MTTTVFVTGATGLIGANVCRLAVEQGDRVRALVRHGSYAQAFSPIAGSCDGSGVVSNVRPSRSSSGLSAAVTSVRKTR